MREYDHAEVEKRWQKAWEEREIYKFNEDSLDNAFVIDTPPPYPTGELHMGHVLNWVYMDIVARYKRMRGYNVLFPQGWDCHGLPTEVKVEEIHGIRKGDIPREKFRKLCIELTDRNIRRMRKQIKSLGCSIDWSTEYITMRPEYIKKSQYAFVEMYEKGLIYRGEHPVNWCPRCETAIADAEVEYEQRETFLNYLFFPLENGKKIRIATTRPELLPACVAIAVHPEDERYKNLVGKEAEIPLFKRKVKIIADEDIDPEFGTGIVMICTFGDKQDVEWIKKHNLPTIRAVDRKGRLTEAAGKYSKLSIEEAKEKIVEDLEKEGYLEKREKIMQNVGKCWRCKTPVEILLEKQWFVDVRSLRDKILEASSKMKWYPSYMEIRLRNWVNSMNWDWVISRQRIFATPIPVWYCKKCGEVIVAKKDELPVFPEEKIPEKCSKCGAKEIEPEKDVLDTWMDSSITPLVIAGWLEDEKKFKKLFPSDLRPQGHDIIRTWAFYTVVKAIALADKEPFKALLINGMVLAEDGRKMSKSLGNVVEPDYIIETYGADALRQWAAMGGAPGSDIPFSHKDVKFGQRFLRKLWNALKFASQHLDDGQSSSKELEIVDRWILSRLNKLIARATESLEEYRFDRAILDIQSFVWHELCDIYIEEIKHRLYNPETYGEESKEAAKFVLRKSLTTILKLLAPFTPHFCEEAYSTFFKAEKSIHLEPWPEVEEELIDEKAEEQAKIINEIITKVRRYKAEKGLPLNYELNKAIIYTTKDKAEIIELSKGTIAGTLRINELSISNEALDLEEKITEIVPDYSKLGPKFKDKAKLIVETMNKEKERILRELKEKGVAKIDGYEILPEYIKEIKKEITSKGERVEVVNVLPEITVVIQN